MCTPDRREGCAVCQAVCWAFYMLSYLILTAAPPPTLTLHVGAIFSFLRKMEGGRGDWPKAPSFQVTGGDWDPGQPACVPSSHPSRTLSAWRRRGWQLRLPPRGRQALPGLLLVPLLPRHAGHCASLHRIIYVPRRQAEPGRLRDSELSLSRKSYVALDMRSREAVTTPPR